MTTTNPEVASTNAQLLAMILNQLEPHVENPTAPFAEGHQKDVLWALAIAAQLDYPVYIIADGWAKIELPVEDRRRSVWFAFPVDLAASQKFEIARPLTEVERDTRAFNTCKTIRLYYESTIPAWQRERLKAVAEGRDWPPVGDAVGEDAGC